MKTCILLRRRATLALLMLSTTACLAGADAQLVEGRDFQLVRKQATDRPQPPTSSQVVEVLEFFSYGCGACDVFHPLGTKWSAELPSNTRVTRVPTALGRRDWKPLVRMFYALQETGNLERLDQALFDAIHRERLRLFSDEALIAWVGRQGVDADAFRAAFHSAAISKRVSWSEQMDKAYAVPSTPTLVIDGKYLVEGANTVQEQLRIASELVDQALAVRRRSVTAPGGPNQNARPASEAP